MKFLIRIECALDLEILKLIFEILPDGIIIANVSDKRFVYANATMCKMTGYSLQEFLKMGVVDLHPSSYLDFILKSFEAAVSGSAHETLDAQIQIKDGSIIYCDINASVFDFKGERFQVGVFRDATRRRKMLEEIKHKTLELDLYFNSSLDLLCIADVEGNFRKVNQEWKNILGYPVAELENKKFLDFVHPDDLSATLETVSKLSAQETVLNFVNRYKHKDGSWRWLEWRSRPSGKLIYAVARDITESKSYEEALIQSERRYRSIVENINDAFYIHDFEGMILDCNDHACSMLGYTRDELIGFNLSLIDSPHEKSLMPKRVASLMEAGFLHFDGEHRKKDGSFVDVSVSAKIVSTQGRGLVQSFVRDISLRKQAEENLIKAQKLESVGMLAGGIAHDFNNLLAGIFGNIELALDFLEAGRTKRVKTFLQKAMGVFGRANSLTRQLLTFSKGGAPILKTGDIIPVVLEAVNFALSGSEIKAVIETECDSLICDFDDHQVAQVIDNIVINAKQSHPADGQIKVLIGKKEIEDTLYQVKPGCYASIWIQDTGIGISEEQLPKVFDPFYTTKKDGSGLGLATSWSIISRHNGFIIIDSLKGIGTIVNVFIPLSDKDFSKTVSSTLSLPGSMRGRILIMDDEQYIIDMSREFFSSMGYEVVTATEGKEAVEYIKDARQKREPYEFIILDLTIPGGMGGKEALGLIKEIEPQIKAIASSGYADDPVIAKPTEHGFASSLSKPYTKKDIIEILSLIK